MQSAVATIASYIGNVHSENRTHRAIARAAISFIEKEFLPHGSGFDSGCTIDLDKSNRDRIVIHAPFHHMNSNGYYVGWTDHKIVVRPTFDGVSIAIGGRDRDGFKDSVYETLHYALTRSFDCGDEAKRFADALKNARDDHKDQPLAPFFT
ncbi:hypothetical protein UFOVP75_14 [uncultured Caudovirales phage]|uniref:Uncharacterized protein n=1 Tax=uncultured Caudovirales phage TaxID=2100421 RepID=A0A6J5KZU6_9CAUD|nr:hypothetical protein UFOVP75_14 [uncultured Caudovirales phage]